MNPYILFIAFSLPKYIYIIYKHDRSPPPPPPTQIPKQQYSPPSLSFSQRVTHDIYIERYGYRVLCFDMFVAYRIHSTVAVYIISEDIQ
jgi:hypothetical protein